MFKAINLLHRHVQTRQFSHLRSQQEMLKQKIKEIKMNEPIDRFSPHDPRASKLIVFVKNREYNRAISLVKEGGLSPDAHRSGENTVLTDCAKRGDVFGTRFCLKELGANPFASCHCPDHRSAFHYASMGGYTEVLEVLYDHVGGTDSSNLLTSSGKTPLDVAKDVKTKQFMTTYKAKTTSSLTTDEKLKLTAPSR